MKTSISNNAHNNIRSIINYTLKISTQYSNRTVNNIYSTIYSIKDSHYIGRYVPELPNTHYRERICGNYRIIYFISEIKNTVYIRYILSRKQNSNLFFDVYHKELYDFLSQF